MSHFHFRSVRPAPALNTTLATPIARLASGLVLVSLLLLGGCVPLVFEQAPAGRALACDDQLVGHWVGVDDAGNKLTDSERVQVLPGCLVEVVEPLEGKLTRTTRVAFEQLEVAGQKIAVVRYRALLDAAGERPADPAAATGVLVGKLVGEGDAIELHVFNVEALREAGRGVELIEQSHEFLSPTGDRSSSRRVLVQASAERLADLATNPGMYSAPLRMVRAD